MLSVIKIERDEIFLGHKESGQEQAQEEKQKQPPEVFCVKRCS